MIKFTVMGTPQPAGSKRVARHGGVIDANKKAAPWKLQVAHAAEDEAMKLPELLDGPIELRVVFYRARPKGHFGTGRNSSKLKPSAPSFPVSKPDALKLTRAVEDALTGVIWRDDAQIVDEHIFKRYGTPERVEVEIAMVDEHYPDSIPGKEQGQ